MCIFCVFLAHAANIQSASESTKIGPTLSDPIIHSANVLCFTYGCGAKSICIVFVGGTTSRASFPLIDRTAIQLHAEAVFHLKRSQDLIRSFALWILSCCVRSSQDYYRIILLVVRRHHGGPGVQSCLESPWNINKMWNELCILKPGGSH